MVLHAFHLFRRSSDGGAFEVYHGSEKTMEETWKQWQRREIDGRGEEKSLMGRETYGEEGKRFWEREEV
ncbi:hypothetical protein KY284_020796 [Solanum tuberosum]|nr:hypothetical protein KY284_020796 [Solanum tuberosum]